MKSWPRYGLISAAALAGLAVAAPFLLPASVYKGEIERAVSRTTGRNFTISGPVRFTLFPAPGLRADDIALANMPGGRAHAMLTAQDVRFALDLRRLLAGRIEISQIILDRPDIFLEVDSQGRANWTLEGPRQAGKADRTPLLTLPINAHLSALYIANGRIGYSSQRSGYRHSIENLDARIAPGEFDGAMTVAGTFASSGERVNFEAKAASPRTILEGRTAALDLSIASNLLQAGFKGTVAPDGHAAGSLRIETPSLRDAATWLGARLPDSGGFGAFSLRSRIAGNNRAAGLSELNASLDGMKIAGDIALDMSGKVPLARGTLSIDRLDLNPYLERPHRNGRSRPHDHDDEWSADPISLDLLKKADAQVTVDAGQVLVRKLKLGKTVMAVALNDGRLNASLNPVALYGGSGNATLDVDARASAPALHTVLKFEDVSLRPFLSDTIGVTQIEGIGTIALDIASHGGSADAIMRGIDGKGAVAFRNGRLRGVDLGAVGRTAQHLLGPSVRTDAITRYAKLEGSFVVARGVLTSQDLKLEGPLLSITGAGAVDVGNRAIDFRIVPQATAVIAHRTLTVGVPFRIKGPWRHVHYVADISGIAKGVLENLKAGRAPFKGMFASPSKPDDKKPDGKKKKHKSLGDALKNMLGIH